ncbi:hypothetical protein F2Q69_00056459 [Brassica cretica]|uniref:Uncharacterized protein n=1 Tax=Brassica cretica TaxID=69181 RepID=A0A8S9MN80_BRACR|nr:hypothetical protein F2Q69_00056459 [Brassica cretica]
MDNVLNMVIMNLCLDLADPCLDHRPCLYIRNTLMDVDIDFFALGLNRITKDQRRAETNGCGMAPIGSRCRGLSRVCFFSRTVASGRGFGLS